MAIVLSSANRLLSFLSHIDTSLSFSCTIVDPSFGQDPSVGLSHPVTVPFWKVPAALERGQPPILTPTWQWAARRDLGCDRRPFC